MIYRLECGNSKELLKTLESNSIDSIVTDPPYELGFMGKKWDNTGISYDVELWTECLRVLKHGGHLLAFSGSRTYHRMAVAIEDAGFDIRDQIQWVYGSGFPKSHNISKAIDKTNGVTGGMLKAGVKNFSITAPDTESAKQWDGWGTALKPAHEPICLARKPLIGTVVENVLAYGTGGINIDGCRVETPETWQRLKGVSTGLGGKYLRGKQEIPRFSNGLGRWPANFIHDGSEEVTQGFPDTKGEKRTEKLNYGTNGIFTSQKNNTYTVSYQEAKGSTSRFFYCAKASKKDRDEGCEGMAKQKAKVTGLNKGSDYSIENGQVTGLKAPTRYASNHHPTVKPTSLMQYLCRLVTPPDGIILDPFLGSGSTGKAAIYEGFNFIGFDLNSEYIDIAKARIEYAKKNKNNTLFDNE